MNEYIVVVEEEDGGPDAAMRERLAKVAAFRLRTLEKRSGQYPKVGVDFDMLDHMAGPFYWQRSQEELDNDPPSRVDFVVVSVDPPDRPATPGQVNVRVRVPF